jgi:wobble nucleotide-excising tRNase
VLEPFTLAAAPCFGNQAVTVGPLAPVTFVFGANGSGKTTISRALADPVTYPGGRLDWGRAGVPLGVKVYNRDYVNATVAGAGELPGVFLLGAGSQDVHREIAELTGTDGTLRRLQTDLAALRITLGDEEQGAGKLGEIKATRTTLAESGWRKRRSIPGALQPMFTGYKHSKDVFLEKVLDVARAHPTTNTDLASLARDAASVFDTTAVEVAELAALTEPRPEEVEGLELLGKPIVGSTGAALATLIEELGNSDWVSQGRAYLNHSDGRCPFCQQDTPHNLANQLRDYFDSRFADQVERLATLVEWHDQQQELLRAALGRVEERSVVQVDATAFAAARAALESTLATNSAELRKKQANPSTTVKLEPIDEDIAAVNTLIASANSLIREHNTRVRNRATERRTLLDKCWQHFVRDTIAADVAVYEVQMPPLVKAKEAIEDKIPTAVGRLRDAEARLRELQRHVRSSKPIIEAINATLASVGFDSFKLAPSAGQRDGYSLLRADGVHVAESLSEGERTFITFLYFFHQLQGEPTDPSEPRELIAIIDDPISSLDSEILFVVSTLTKRLIADIRAATGRVRQLVLLTHNVHFHREVTYPRHGESGGGRQYLVLRKRCGQPTELVAYADNPVKTAYRSLWNEVRTATDNPASSLVGIQNVLRRILENYFRIMGEIDEDAIITTFSGSDQAICRSLFSWINDGSHTIIDEIDYSPSETETAVWLRVFREIFVNSEHGGHYAMMMRNPD